MRMMKALDENAIEEKNTYRVESSEREYDADGNVSSLVSIFQTNNKKEKEIRIIHNKVKKKVVEYVA